MKKSQKTITFTVLAMILLVTAIIFCFYIISLNKGKEKTKKPETEAEEIIMKDIADHYPETPGEVVKLYIRITKCLYNDKISDEEMEALVDQLRLLFDRELLAQNPKESHIAGIQAEIEEFRKDGITILDYDASDSKETEYGEVKKEELAAVQARIFMMDSKKKRTNTKEDFLLRKDEEGKWKIAQWQLSTDANE